MTNQNERHTLRYWLVDIEGLHPDTADSIIAMDRDGLNPVAAYDGLSDMQASISRAYEGFMGVSLDC